MINAGNPSVASLQMRKYVKEHINHHHKYLKS
jgi:hypothetical protein